MARKTKLTPAIQAKMMQMIQQGISLAQAAEACGVTPTTVYNWRNRGEAAKSGRYFDFYHAYVRARAEAEVILLGRIQLAGQAGDWRAAAWILERRFRDRWGKELKVNIDYSLLSDDQLERILAGEHPASVVAG